MFRTAKKLPGFEKRGPDSLLGIGIGLVLDVQSEGRADDECHLRGPPQRRFSERYETQPLGGHQQLLIEPPTVYFN